MQQTIIVNGAFGKMGTITCQTIKDNENFKLLQALGRSDDLSRAIKEHQPDVVIDFTNALSAYQNAKTIIAEQTKAIIGSSGITEQQINELTKQCELQKLGVIIAPNFSIGALLMMKSAAMVAKYLPDAEIIETHHAQKIDSPSGTAIKTAKIIASNRKTRPEIDTKELSRGEEVSGVPVHAVRLPGFIASQQVIFGAQDENLTISHQSISRASFMPGVLLALEKIQELNHLVYGLEHFL